VIVPLVASLAGNGLDHYRRAYATTPPWRVVSAIAPAVVAAVVHLFVLVARPPTDATTAHRARSAEHRFRYGSVRLVLL
jgi:hypothetical protein